MIQSEVAPDAIWHAAGTVDFLVYIVTQEQSMLSTIEGKIVFYRKLYFISF